MKNMKKTLLIITLLACFAVEGFSQSKVYAGYVRWSSDYGDSLAIVDTTGGTWTLEEHIALTTDGPSAVDGTYGLSYDINSGLMYILYQHVNGSETDRRLGTLDTITGAITDIGVAGNLSDIAIFNDTIYGTVASQDGSHRLVWLDRNTGAATDVFTYAVANYGPAIAYSTFDNNFYRFDNDNAYLVDVAGNTESLLGIHNPEAHAILPLNDSTLLVASYEDLNSWNLNDSTLTQGIFTFPEEIHALAFGADLFILSPNGNRVCSNVENTFSLNETGTAYQWRLDGVDIPGATNPTYVPVASGLYTCILDGKESAPRNYEHLIAPDASFTSVPNPVDLGIDPTGTIDFTNTSAPDGDMYSWNFDNGFTTTTENPSFPFTAVGTYDVTFINTNTANGCVDTATVAIEVISTADVSEIESTFNVYPVPTNDIVNIENTSSTGTFNAQITDMSGRVIAEKELKNGMNGSFDLTSADSGVYILKVYDDSSEAFFRVIKK